MHHDVEHIQYYTFSTVYSYIGCANRSGNGNIDYMAFESVKNWLSKSLSARDLDAEFYTDYIFSLLESGEDVLEWLNIINENDPTGNTELAVQLLKYYNSDEVIVESDVNDDIVALSAVVDDLTCGKQSPPNDSSSFPPHDTKEDIDFESMAATNIEDLLLDYDYQDSYQYDCQPEDDCQYDESDDIIDYADLAFTIDAYFTSEYSPSIHFSPDAIYSSLQYTSGNTHSASGWLLYTHQLVVGDEYSTTRHTPKPCRHLIQSGRCFRSDCSFDHHFSSMPCRFWLFVGGCSAANGCVFMHSLPPLEDALASGYIFNEEADGMDKPWDNCASNAAALWKDESAFPTLSTEQPPPKADISQQTAAAGEALDKSQSQSLKSQLQGRTWANMAATTATTVSEASRDEKSALRSSDSSGSHPRTRTHDGQHRGRYVSGGVAGTTGGNADNGSIIVLAASSWVESGKNDVHVTIKCHHYAVTQHYVILFCKFFSLSLFTITSYYHLLLYHSLLNLNGPLFG